MKGSSHWLDYESALIALSKEVWNNGMTKWAGIDLLDIAFYMYLIGAPCEYARENLQANQSLEAYNYGRGMGRWPG